MNEAPYRRRRSRRLRRLAAAMMLTTCAAAAMTLTIAPARPLAEQASCAAQAPSGIPAARLTALARGFNLTGWLDQAEPRRPDMATLAALRGRGFTHVRLPVKAELLMEAFTSADDVAQHFAELDRALDSLLELDFAVTIDMHPGDRFGALYKTEPKRAFELIAPLWRQLARRYAGRPADRVFFEVLNEPTAAPEIWDVDGPRLVAAIRQEAPAHTIVYGEPPYQRVDQLPDLRPLADENVIYAVHFYDPMVFTHQGLDWAPDDPLRFADGVPFPVQASDPPITRLLQTLVMKGEIVAAAKVMAQLRQPWTEARIDAAFADAQAWAARYRRAVTVNEFGVLSYKAAPASRIRWLAAVRGAAERHCIGWAHWEYADSFGFVHRFEDGHERPDDALVRALLGEQS